MNIKQILVRAAVTAVESFLGAVIAVGTTDLTIEGVELAALTAAGAALSVVYNALRQWLDTTGAVKSLPASEAGEGDPADNDEHPL